MYDNFNYDYAALYRMQPNLRTCIDFLARNVAQLGLHVFRRVSDTDRERLTDHGAAKLLGQPLPPVMKVTTYRMIEALMSDLGIYFNAYWLKIRQDGIPSGLLRIPPIYITPRGGLIPKLYELTVGGLYQELQPNDVVHIHGYNPENPISGLSPMETLRRILAEEHEAGLYRENFWQNAARKEGVVNRPREAPEWSDTARERFIADFQQAHSGADNSGKIVVLEEGMIWQDTSFNAQESEYIEGRKLTRVECARAYHIPLPMVGILDNATLTNIREQHQNLYQDCIGPWTTMIEQDIELQLLPEFEDSDNVYVEFNLQEKLKGDFEEQIKTLQSAIGRPWMTPNEGRARMNLPSMGGDADRLATPLNVIVGGQASPRDSAPPPKQKMLEAKGFDSVAPQLRARHEQKWVEILSRHYRRQESVIVSRVPAAISSNDGKSDLGGGVWWDEERWNSELSVDLLRLNKLTTIEWAKRMLELMGTEIEDWAAFEDRMLPWLAEHSRIQAEYFNTQTREALSTALLDPDPLEAVKGIFNTAITVWASREAISAVTNASNFGSHEAANASGLREKRWRVNSNNPRPTHAAINGETVGIRENFSNGLRWPGDSRGSADETAGCRCSVEFLGD
jgi:HK97 family phage portal protein